MSFAPSSPVTGGAQTGLTSPTYTIAIDTAPSSNGKQYAVTALGGTQTGVEVSSTSNPFTITMFKVASPKSLPVLNPVTGVLSNVPKNTYKLIVRKGIEVMSGQPRQIQLVSMDIAVPAGADVQDPESVRAALSLAIGTLWANSAAIGDVLIQNLL
jgi:hypothetical protein